MDEIILDCETSDEANDLLKNGILVETSKGVVCMSLTDALSSSDLNLSVEDLQNVATKLILEQNVPTTTTKVNLVKDNKVFLKQTSTLNFDSDGFSSECSDISTTSASSVQSNFINLNPAILLNEHGLNSTIGPKFVSFLPRAIDSHNKGSKFQITNNKNFTIIPIKSSAPSCSSSSLTTNKSLLSETTIITNNNKSIIVDNNQTLKDKIKDDGNNTPTTSTVTVVEVKKQKGRGGWPKGRKRKPELLNLPPKAPATGYNLYLNDQRKLFKDSSLVFHEITKIIGNKWSNLSLEDKQPYLAKAEEDKRRYRDELKQYRQSDAYRAYLLKKRKNRLQNNVLSESDMDATDEIDDEDNEELYCRTCDQWFHNLHNKREHLQGRQHTQTVAGDMKKELYSNMTSTATNTSVTASSSTSLDESSLDGITASSSSSAAFGSTEMSNEQKSSVNSSSTIADTVVTLMTVVSQREKEIKLLQTQLQETFVVHTALCQQLSSLTKRQSKLKNDLISLKRNERDMEAQVFRLWQVPSWFIITKFENEPTTAINDQ